MKRFNWAMWAGFTLSVFAFLSYPLIFVNWAVTRDFPWANLFLFAVAAGLLFVGVRRAFTPDRRRVSKIVAAIVSTLSTLLVGMFIFTAFVAARWLPASAGAPQVRQGGVTLWVALATDQRQAGERRSSDFLSRLLVTFMQLRVAEHSKEPGPIQCSRNSSSRNQRG